MDHFKNTCTEYEYSVRIICGFDALLQGRIENSTLRIRVTTELLGHSLVQICAVLYTFLIPADKTYADFSE